jgi:NitT/TauT family transport system substrate-binding protein
MGADFSARSNAVVQASLDHIEYGYNITAAIKTGLVDFTNMFINLNQTTTQTLHDRGYSTVSDFINAFTNSSVVTAAMNVQPSAVSVGTIKLGYLSGDLHQFARVVAMNATLFGGQNLFEKYGVTIEPVAPFGNGGLVMDAFATGLIDAGYLGAPPAILKRLNANTDITVVALANMEGTAIVADKGITTIGGLANKTVGTPGAASIQHLLLLVYAQQNGYTVKLKGT